MIRFLPFRRPVRPQLLTERGQGLAVLIFGLAVLFLVVALAKGRL